MITLTVTRFYLRNPTWSKNTAVAGETLTLSVEAPHQTATQWIEFRLSLGNELIETILSKPGRNTAEWKAPNLKRAAVLTHQITFTATLMESPAASNGFVGVFDSVPCPTPLTLHGFDLTFTACDGFFVPRQEQLNAAYTITNPGAAALRGRFEVWAERYPGDTPKPAYTEAFTPAAGPQTWASWDGKANHGELKGEYLTPEFSPYRVRAVIGPDTGSIQDPWGDGAGVVSMDERTFEISVHFIHIRIFKDAKEAAKKDEYKLASALGVANRLPNGEFDHYGRLPNGPRSTIGEQNSLGVGPVQNETARIRIPLAIFSNESDNGGQTGLNVADGYGPVKWDNDQNYYTRPELPIEFEPRLRSRDNNINTDPEQLGLFEPEAIGPLMIEPFCEDDYSAGAFVGGARQSYWNNAALKVKRGGHDAPYHTGANAPEFLYWQARFVGAAGQQNFDVTTVDNTYGFTRGADELKVYLNSALLKLSIRNDDNELNERTHDYREMDPGVAPMATVVRLRPELVEANDVVWIVRVPNPAPGGPGADVEDWDTFPPGINCHKYYGGERGKKPTADLVNYFRKKYSPNPAKPLEPIIGKLSGSDFRYHTHIDLRPAPLVPQDEQERVQITALQKGKRKGVAGVLFSPSFIGGDAYKLHALLEDECYLRSFGYNGPKPHLDDETGRLTVWRLALIKKSFRLPDQGTNGLAPGVGSFPELAIGAPVPATHPPGTTPRVYRGDGLNMSFTAANGIGTFMGDSFCEWVVPRDPGPAEPGGDPAQFHRNINVRKYRKTVNKFMKGTVGRFKMNSNADVKNWLAVWDPYRNQLPPGLPAGLINLISNVVAAWPAGTQSDVVAGAVRAALVFHGANPDVALNAGVTQLNIFAGGNASDYSSWVEDIWDDMAHDVLDKFLGTKAAPKYMNVLRWPYLHENSLWIGYNAATNTPEFETSRTNGECIGSGKSYFLNALVTETFSHEMGHSVQLEHFVAGNFEWKHHNVSTPECLMSYAHKKATLEQAFVGAPAVGPNAGGGGTVETGWPHVKNGQPCIHFRRLNKAPVIARSAPCAKCALKVRGWKEDVLPFAWNHPDLF